MKNKRLIVVLGMHRSGSSAITKGLELMGVSLGTHLMSADANNEKGYFEDIELNQINTEILKASGHNWNSLSLIPDTDLLSDKLTGLKDRATDILKEKLADTEILGIKDPRFCRLLPFWKGVFNDLKLDVSYVIILRDPESIAASLFSRDAYPRVKSLYLWLEHMVPVLRETRASKRSVIDFDQLVAQPRAVIETLAKDLKLSGQLDQDALKSYEKEFIDASLKHHQREPDSETGFTPRVITKLDVLLHDVSEQKISIDSPEFMDEINEIEEEFKDKSDVLAYIDTLDSIILRDHFSLKNANAQLDNLTSNYDQAKKTLESKKKIITRRNLQIKGFKTDVANRDELLASLQHSLSDRDSKIEALELTMSDRDSTIASLAHSLSDRDLKVESLEHSLADRDSKIGSLEHSLSDHDSKIESLEHSLADRDSIIKSLEHSVSDRDLKVESLEHSLAARESNIEALKHSLSDRNLKIESLEHSLSDRDLNIKTLEYSLSDRDLKVESLEHSLSARESNIEALEHSLSDRDLKIEALEGSLHAKKVKINTYINQIDSLQQQVESNVSDTEALAAQLEETQSSLFWRLSVVSRKFWQFFELIFTPKKEKFHLIPSNELKRVRAMDHSWMSIGYDPHFKLVPLSGKMPGGWTRIKTCIQSDAGESEFKLYLDLGDGLSEKNVATIPVTSRGYVDEIIHLPESLKVIRWDPTQHKGEFKQLPIVFSRTSWLRRKLHMISRVTNVLWNAPAEIKKENGLAWKTIVSDLNHAYEATRPVIISQNMLQKDTANPD